MAWPRGSRTCASRSPQADRCAVGHRPHNGRLGQRVRSRFACGVARKMLVNLYIAVCAVPSKRGSYGTRHDRSGSDRGERGSVAAEGGPQGEGWAAAGSRPMTGLRSDALVFFGATGDLAYKKIFPALQRMIRRGRLDMPMIGVASSELELEQFRARARHRRQKHGGVTDAA